MHHERCPPRASPLVSTKLALANYGDTTIHYASRPLEPDPPSSLSTLPSALRSFLVFVFTEAGVSASEFRVSLAPRSRLFNAKLLVNLDWRKSVTFRRLSSSFSLFFSDGHPPTSPYTSHLHTTTCHDTITSLYTFVPTTLTPFFRAGMKSDSYA